MARARRESFPRRWRRSGSRQRCSFQPPRAWAGRHRQCKFLATNAGFEVLAKGGNAFDAAVAVSSTLAVVEQQSSGIGGGFMALLHRASDNRNVFIDARETAPKAVDMKVYVGQDGKPNRDVSTNGPLSAGIPGEPAGLVWMAEHYGKLPLAVSLAPAIRIAKDGFQPDARFLGTIEDRKDVLARYPASAAIYLPDGKVPSQGWTLRQPDLAKTLERLAAKVSKASTRRDGEPAGVGFT